MPGITITADSATEFTASTADFNSSCRLDDNTFVIMYRDVDDFNYGKVIVGTRDGTSITINEADAETFTNSGTTEYYTVRALSSTKIIITYYDNITNNTYARVGTVSGKDITFGAETVISASAGSGITVAVLDSSNVVFSISDASGSDEIRCYVASISGTTISTGSEYAFQPLDSADQINGATIASIGLDSTHCAITYYSNNPSKVEARVFSIDTVLQTITSGTPERILTGGDPTEFNEIYIDKFNDTHFVVGTKESTVFTIIACSYNTSTLAVTDHSSISTETGITQFSLVVMDDHSLVVSYYTSSGTQGEVRSATLTGLTLAWDSQGAQVFDTSTVAYNTLCKLTYNYFLLAFKKG